MREAIRVGCKYRRMTGLDDVDPGNPTEIDTSSLDIDEVIELLANPEASNERRRKAIAAAVELLAPAIDEEWALDETDRRIVAGLLQIARDGSADGNLLDAAGDALGLAWIWRNEFDRNGFLSMTSAAQYAARRVVGEENGDWLSDMPASAGNDD